MIPRVREINPEEIVRTLLSQGAREVFEENGVLVAYLYGSVAQGKTHAHSDVDVAVVFEQSVPQSEHFRKRVALIGKLMDLLHLDEVDVVPLNRGPLLLTKEVLRHPVILYVADEVEATEFELKALGLSYDFMPILDSYIEEMSSRIKARGLG